MTFTFNESCFQMYTFSIFHQRFHFKIILSINELASFKLKLNKNKYAYFEDFNKPSISCKRCLAFSFSESKLTARE